MYRKNNTAELDFSELAIEEQKGITYEGIEDTEDQNVLEELVKEHFEIKRKEKEYLTKIRSQYVEEDTNHNNPGERDEKEGESMEASSSVDVCIENEILVSGNVNRLTRYVKGITHKCRLCKILSTITTEDAIVNNNQKIVHNLEQYVGKMDPLTLAGIGYKWRKIQEEQMMEEGTEFKFWSRAMVFFHITGECGYFNPKIAMLRYVKRLDKISTHIMNKSIVEKGANGDTINYKAASLVIKCAQLLTQIDSKKTGKNELNIKTIEIQPQKVTTKKNTIGGRQRNKRKDLHEISHSSQVYNLEKGKRARVVCNSIDYY